MSDEDQDAAALLDKLYGDWEFPVWRAQVGGRFLIFLIYRNKTYCLLPESDWSRAGIVAGAMPP